MLGLTFIVIDRKALKIKSVKKVYNNKTSISLFQLFLRGKRGLYCGIILLDDEVTENITAADDLQTI